MQMILIERCTFYLPTAIFVRTKAKVRVSPKGWRTVFGRFAECKFLFARRQKCVSAPKAGARSLSLEDLPTANFRSHEGNSAYQPKRLVHGLLKICRVQISVRTKAKVHISPKGWRTVFGRFAECKDKHYSRNLQTFNSLLLSLFNK